MSNKENNSKKSLSLSMDLNAAGKFSEASIILENYLKKEPNDYIALVNLASNITIKTDFYFPVYHLLDIARSAIQP